MGYAHQASPVALLLVNESVPDTHPVLFERVTGDLIRSTVLRV